MELTKYKIMALTDNELDCATAVAHGWVNFGILLPYWVNQNKYAIDVADYHPSTNGQQLLQIMDRNKIGVYFDDTRLAWIAHIVKYEQDKGTSVIKSNGETINQAVLRCYLISKQGGNK